MAKTANLYARIEPELKEQAERILSTLGIPVSTAINVFYKQIILQRGMPFDLKVPMDMPLDINTLTATQLDEELEKGYVEMLEGKTKDATEVFAQLHKDYD